MTTKKRRPRTDLALEAPINGDNPFPFELPNGRTVIDELCVCGHRRTEHGPGRAGAFGHGACRVYSAISSAGDCDCEQFTWASRLERAGRRR